MPLHPQCQAVLEAGKAHPPLTDTEDAAEARRRYAASNDALRLPPPALRAIVNRTIPGPASEIPVRVYTPDADGPLPLLLFYHGGGWVVGDLDSHDSMCRFYSHEAGCVVVSVDYRMGPEHRFPAAIEDAQAALGWARENAAMLGIDANWIAVGGDSAGGNIAAALCLLARDDGGPAIRLQLLIYPATDFTATSGSRVAHGEGKFLTTEAMAWFESRYLNGPQDRTDPRASPLLAASHAGLPQAFVQTAEYDPLCDEGKAYADKLAAAGVATDYTCYPGMIHGFARMGVLVDMGMTALADGAAALKAAFAKA